MKPLLALIHLLAGVLEPEEREAVLGDLAEAGASRIHTVAQLLGLIARRYTLAWAHVGPWVALLFGILPIGLVLSILTRWLSDEITTRMSWYVTAWFPGYFDNPGIRNDLLAWILGTVVPLAAVLVAWSSTLGFAVGRLCQKTLLPPLAVFVILLFGATVGVASTFARHHTAAAAFYATFVAILVRVLFVAVPLLLGVLKGRANTIPSRLSVAIAAIAIAGFTAFTMSGVELALTFGRGVIPIPGSDNIVGTADDVRTFVPWVNLWMLWPLAYVAVVTMLRPQHRTP